MYEVAGVGDEVKMVNSFHFFCGVVCGQGCDRSQVVGLHGIRKTCELEDIVTVLRLNSKYLVLGVAC